MKINRKELEELKESEHYEFIQNNGTRYSNLFKIIVVVTILVAVAPLIVMALVYIYQYQKAFKQDILYPLNSQTTNIANTLNSFIEERYAALKFISKEKSFDEMSKKENLSSVLRHLKESFNGYIDLGVIDSKGNQISYVGPYNLEGKSYSEQMWFNETVIKGDYISDVFMGYRGLPHFTLAVVKELGNNDFYILRATISSDKLYSLISYQKILSANDVFLINKSGILQTPSKFNGEILTQWSMPVPSYTSDTEIIETNHNNKSFFLAYAYIQNSSFILIEMIESESVMSNWRSTRNNLIIFLSLSTVIIVIVIFWGSYRMVNYIREYEFKMIKFLREVSYTNKLATIGRLAAGVSHEINNPLAIINENAGIIKDILQISKNFDEKEKIIRYTTSIVNAVERCSRITHRLLGFAKRMDTQIDTINVKDLINEVISFVDKELQHRSISINIDSYSESPIIKSDKGQIQQVLLNLLNNALDAVNDGGSIEIKISKKEGKMRIACKDNGIGISKEEIQKIFDPFYSSKREKGTGLGLFITYGIVQKLGGNIEVESLPGVGSVFTVILPVENHKIKE